MLDIVVRCTGKDELRVYKKQLDALREDFKLLVHYSDVARGQIKLVADGGGIRALGNRFRSR